MEDDPQYLVIPAAGLGKRMRSIGRSLPKELLPVGGKPAIQFAVEEGLSAGIREVVIIINRDKEIIRRYFEDKQFRHNKFPLATQGMEEIEKECSITFLYQKEPLGESDAIALARGVVGNHPVSIIYPDNIYFPAPGALKILKNVFRERGEDVTALTVVTEENGFGVGNSGRVELKPLKGNIFRIARFHPKGPGHFVPKFEGELRACGIYISGPHIFEYVERARGLIKKGELTDLPVRTLILRDRGLLGCRLPGNVFDIGNPKGYELCLAYTPSL
ncbi:MAG: sugar phosphate nucleotidyltransferase [Pseudomonadota bacterium]